MPSKTFVPAFEAKVGNWTYYSCLMSYAQVAREINFAHELGGNRDLGTMIQRGVGTRTEKITDYLLTNENRFLGAIIIAVWGGDPNYLSVEMDSENQAVLQGLDRNFGVLTFDGTQQFFALDGQHRLKAIKDAIKQNPELGSEDINVIVVPHFDTPDGRRRTRRLFTNINRNAKSTNSQENIALDEDDSFAILTRRLLDDDPFLNRDKVVLVFSKVGQDGELVLAQRSITATSPAWSTIGVLYDITKEIGFDLPCANEQSTQRVTDELLDQSFELLSARVLELLDACGNLRQRYLASVTPKDLRAPKGRDGAGHPFMRPAIQVQVARAVRHVLEQETLTWPEVMKRLAALDWKMTSAPFSSMWIETPEGTKAKGKMASGNTQLLYDLLLVHLAPRSKAQISRALRSYADVMKAKYPVPAEELFALLPVDAD
ncbi:MULTISPECIES: DNA sulfur modification protein DndB [Streptomyces]|uniref:DNA sulfur modification protein DndB n=1 Tax=Streptomyces TaxID=1883 RepID=UPI00226E7B95|nr:MULTISPECIES: DNA sulfur modification protein DndB [unclassified Streptomyces]MCY0940124.1 DGQHR domain-containing protein [Streptomyces sp. H34-AA3]MCZ4080772.1 DGQHR domain-containing protein [Streptomyces sp. H34-S5]